MAAGTLKKQWQVAGNGGWAETFNFYLGNASAPDDLTGMSASLLMIRPGRPASEAMVFSSADDPARLTVSGGSVAIDIPRTVTTGWTPGTYDVQLRVIDPASDVDRYNLVGAGRLTVIEAPGA